MVNLSDKFFRRISGLSSDKLEDTLLVWRKRIFSTIFLCSCITVPFAYIPNIQYAIQLKQWSLAIIYTLAVLIVITITTVHSIPFKVRVWTGLFIYYGVGLISLLALGPVGSGRIFLFAFALLASLLLGLRAGILALALNICTFFALGWMLSTDQLQWSHITIQASNNWAATGYTFFFLNTVVTVSLGVLVAVLEKHLKKEQSLTKELKLSNEQLEKENSDRKLAEESLRKSEERFRIVSQITSDFSYSFRVDDDHNLALEWMTEAISRITEFDAAELSAAEGWTSLIHPTDKSIKDNQLKTLDLLGCSEDFLLKTPCIEFIHPEDRNTVITSHRSRIQGGKPPSTYSFRVINTRGDEIWTQLNTTLITWEGRPATLNFLRDITEQKGLEFQLQQAQKMEAIGTLAGGVAHDLNNILSGMVSYPELLLLDLPDDSPLRKPIETIQQSGQKAAAIVQDLLTLARRGVSTSEVVNLNQVISQYLSSPEHKKIISYHPKVEVKTHLETDLFNILGSPVHLSKTLMNLVSNSAEAMPDGGSIIIRIYRRSEFAWERDHIYHLFSDNQKRNGIA